MAALAAGGALVRVVGQLLSRYDDVDTLGLLGLAADLAGGAGLAARDLAYWPPLPSALTALLTLAGLPVREAGLLLVLLAGVATVFPAAWLGRALGGPAGMRWAAAGAAFLPHLVIAAQRFHAEPVAGLFLLGAACLALVQRWPRPHLAALGTGLLAALAYLSRFELLAAFPLLLAAVVLLPRDLPLGRRLGLALAAAAGFGLAALPYALLLDHLGHGFGLVPEGRVNANLTFTLSGNQVSYGLPGAREAAADASAGAQQAWDQRAALLRHVLEHAGTAPLWRAILRMVSPAVLVLAGLELARRADAETRRLQLLLLALALPSVAALIIADDHTRYWTPWALVLLPLAAARLPRLLADRGVAGQLAPVLALGLLALPRAVSPDAPMPLWAPGEAPGELLGDLLAGRLDLALVQTAPGGALAVLVPVLVALVVLGALGAVVAPRGRRLAAPLLGAAAATGLLQLHFEHLRITTPPCHFQENIPLLGVGADCRIAATWSLDAYVLGESSELPGLVGPGIWVPPPRSSLPPERQQAWWEHHQPDVLVVDAGLDGPDPIAELVARRGLSPLVSSPEDAPHLQVYAATSAGEACVRRWQAWRAAAP